PNDGPSTERSLAWSAEPPFKGRRLKLSKALEQRDPVENRGKPLERAPRPPTIPHHAQGHESLHGQRHIVHCRYNELRALAQTVVVCPKPILDRSGGSECQNSTVDFADNDAEASDLPDAEEPAGRGFANRAFDQ